ncbi:MAG: histidine phosphatase family protein [Clostridia bacterium]|nr:histidine phosphatase family protein [Clostridia bacterium]
MIFYYIRHGDPIYDPDSLTPLGRRQAEAAGKRLSVFGVDKIYASSSTRAIQTSQPTCEMLKKEAEILDFCNEGHAWQEFSTIDEEGNRTWLFHHGETRKLFAEKEVRDLGHRWTKHPKFTEHQKGIDRIRKESDALFLSLGYEHIPETGKYKVINGNDQRVALFAHQGFGLAFLSCVLDIPYPQFTLHFDMCHSGITAIDFHEEDGFAYPRVMMLSSDAHLYKEGLPLNYNHEKRV